MPILEQNTILKIAGNLKAFLRLEAGITRGGLPASAHGPSEEQELGRTRARARQQKRQIKQLRRRPRQAKKGGQRGGKNDERIKKLRGQLERVRGQLKTVREQ